MMEFLNIILFNQLASFKYRDVCVDLSCVLEPVGNVLIDYVYSGYKKCLYKSVNLYFC